MWYNGRNRFVQEDRERSLASFAYPAREVVTLAVDWIAVRNEYINGGGSYRKLAEKYGIPLGTLRARAEKEKWVKLKEKQLRKISTKTAQKTADKIAKQEADRVARIHAASDELLSKIERAILELDSAQVSRKKKVKTTEYKDRWAVGKPTKEVVTEEEQLETVPSVVDRKGLQQIATALKQIWEMADSQADGSDEVEDDGLLEALGASAQGLFASGDDSGMLPKEKSE